MKTSLILFIGLSGGLLAQDFEYIGAENCKMCHMKTSAGAQYKVWDGSKHANAFETLKSEQAVAIAKEQGLEKDPWEAPECLKCHTTAYGNGGYEVMSADFWNPPSDDRAAKKDVKRMEGLQSVGCEACHGPGSEYKSMRTMKQIFSGEVEGATVGLMTSTEETCVGCHNEESPTFKGFDFDEYYGKITHPYPEGYRK